MDVDANSALEVWAENLEQPLRTIDPVNSKMIFNPYLRR